MSEKQISRLPSVSIIIRTLNEEKYIGECLSAIEKQHYSGEIEKIVIDSGSTDATVNIAREFGAVVTFIDKQRFSFGRSLNQGCKESTGEFLVLLSAHCIPTTDDWLIELVRPLAEHKSMYSYGRQIPRDGVSKFSEGMVYRQYYPTVSALPQEGYFCNNANSAIARKTWEKFKFDEELTGLEDLELAKRIVSSGGHISYSAQSVVEHIHEESWRRIRTRYEREAVALLYIDPALSLSFFHAARLFLVSVSNDWHQQARKSIRSFTEILFYRFNQYLGSYVGSKASRSRILKMKNEYYYPRTSERTITIGYEDEDNCATPNESS